ALGPSGQRIQADFAGFISAIENACHCVASAGDQERNQLEIAAPVATRNDQMAAWGAAWGESRRDLGCVADPVGGVVAIPAGGADRTVGKHHLPSDHLRVAIPGLHRRRNEGCRYRAAETGTHDSKRYFISRESGRLLIEVVHASIRFYPPTAHE